MAIVALRLFRTVNTQTALMMAGIMPIGLKARDRAVSWIALNGVMTSEAELHLLSCGVPLGSAIDRLSHKRWCTPDIQKFTAGDDDCGAMLLATDGSKNGQRVGAAVCSFQDGQLTSSWYGALPHYATAGQAEFAAICHAVGVSRRVAAPCVILTDSKVAARWASHCLALPAGCCIRWAKSHSGNAYNDTADAAARVAWHGVFVPTPLPKVHIKRRLRTNSQLAWQSLYDSAVADSEVRFFALDHRRCNIIRRYGDVHVWRFLSGHCGVGKYLHERGLVDTPSCSCGALSQTVRHVVFRCPRLLRSSQFFRCTADGLYELKKVVHEFLRL
jgi:ribonuclease HI